MWEGLAPPSFDFIAHKSHMSVGTLAFSRAASRLITPCVTKAFKRISNVCIPDAPPV